MCGFFSRVIAAPIAPRTRGPRGGVSQAPVARLRTPEVRRTHGPTLDLQHHASRHRRSQRHLLTGTRHGLRDHRLGREPDPARESRDGRGAADSAVASVHRDLGPGPVAPPEVGRTSGLPRLRRAPGLPTKPHSAFDWKTYLANSGEIRCMVSPTTRPLGEVLVVRVLHAFSRNDPFLHGSDSWTQGPASA